jgi:hypothetical protein
MAAGLLIPLLFKDNMYTEEGPFGKRKDPHLVIVGAGCWDSLPTLFV